jgi:hypothetical protein
MSRFVDSSAPPKTMQAMAVLGLKPQPTDDSRCANFSGHGLDITVASTEELGVPEILRRLVEKGRREGAEEVRAGLRALLGLKG